MEKSGNKKSLLIWLESLPEDEYHLIIVKDKKHSLNQLHAILRKAKPVGMKFNDWKIIVKDEMGLFYFEDGEKVYRSFKNLTQSELDQLFADYDQI